MPSIRYVSLAALSVPILLIAGCGDGWEVVKYTGFPYNDMERTAGSGVEYVRAKLMPEKGPIVESVKQTTTVTAPQMSQPVPPPAPPVEGAEEIFNKSQRK